MARTAVWVVVFLACVSASEATAEPTVADLVREADIAESEATAEVQRARLNAETAARALKFDEWINAQARYEDSLKRAIAVMADRASAVFTVPTTTVEREPVHQKMHHYARMAGDWQEWLAVVAAVGKKTDLRWRTKPDAEFQELMRTFSYGPCTGVDTRLTTAAPTVTNPQRQPASVPTVRGGSSSASASLLARFPPRGQYAHRLKIAPRYDRFLNETQVWVQRFRLGIKRSWPDAIFFQAAFGFKGTQMLGVPGNVVLVFDSWRFTEQGWRYLKNHRLVLLLDSAPLDLGETIYDGDVRAGLTEVMVVSVPTETFLRIVSANRIEGRLGGDVFEFERDEIQALRDLASRMRPQ
jgi:hypothetical protein